MTVTEIEISDCLADRCPQANEDNQEAHPRAFAQSQVNAMQCYEHSIWTVAFHILPMSTCCVKPVRLYRRV